LVKFGRVEFVPSKIFLLKKNDEIGYFFCHRWPSVGSKKSSVNDLRHFFVFEISTFLVFIFLKKLKAKNVDIPKGILTLFTVQ